MLDGIPPRYCPTGEEFSGGMGKVLICQDTNLDRKVAIKFIQNVRDQRRLFDEIAALQKIRSKHVVQIFDVFLNETDRKVGIVQEYIPGDDLASFVNQNLIAKDEYLKILYQISSGINDIHNQGLIHRDIKPNNMKFDQANIIKIFDFGLARFSGRDDSTLGFTGTPGFAAPELYRSGLIPFTSAVDVYAFGMIAWYLSGENFPEKLLQNPPSLADFPGFSSLNLDIPDDIVNILDRTVSLDATDRPLMSDIKDILENYLLYGRHRALLVHGNKTYNLEKVNRIIKLDVSNYGSLDIKYDGLNFIAEAVKDAVYINNKLIKKGQQLPKHCVITLGDSSHGRDRLFITFDVSNPEVVL